MNKSNTKETKKSKNNKANLLPRIIVGLGIILSIAYISFTIFFCQDEIAQPAMIINGLLISMVVLSISLSMMIVKEKPKRLLSIISILLIMLFITLQVLTKFNIIKIPNQPVIPDFTNNNIVEVIKFSEKHKIKLNQFYEHSEDIKEYNVTRQSVKANTLLKNVKQMNIYISDGADPNKEIIIGNMVGWHVDDVIKVIDDNKLVNVNFDFQINNEVEKNKVITQSVSGQVKRNTKIDFLASLGTEDQLVPVKMIDLTNLTLFKSTFWLKQNGIKYEIKYEFSKTIMKGNVISQSKPKDEMVDPKTDKITLIISKGEEITVPNFSKMKMEEIINWAITNNLKLRFLEEYNSTIDLGKVIKANYKENDKIEEGTEIVITISKGTLKLKDFKSVTEFRTWASENNIKYREEYEFNDNIAKGNIIKFNLPSGSVINEIDEVIIYISDGKKVVVPNFYGLNKTTITSKCNSLGLSCTFSTQYSNTVGNGLAISQNKKANSEVSSGTNVSVVLSKGPAPSGGGTTPPTPPPTCDKSKTIVIYLQPKDTVTNTINSMRNAYPGIKFNFVQVDNPGYGDAGKFTQQTVNSFDGARLNYCDTYTLYVIKN